MPRLIVDPEGNIRWERLESPENKFSKERDMPTDAVLFLGLFLIFISFFVIQDLCYAVWGNVTEVSSYHTSFSVTKRFNLLRFEYTFEDQNGVEHSESDTVPSPWATYVAPPRGTILEIEYIPGVKHSSRVSRLMDSSDQTSSSRFFKFIFNFNTMCFLCTAVWLCLIYYKQKK